MHLHVAAWPTNKATTCSASDDPAGTPLLRQAVGGASLLDSLLLFCPNANSYRRAPGQQLRAAGDLGVDNRTVSLRVPGGPASSRHIEHRICGADANPYLAAAALLAGVHRGIREGTIRARRWRAMATPRPASACPPTG